MCGVGISNILWVLGREKEGIGNEWFLWSGCPDPPPILLTRAQYLDTDKGSIALIKKNA